MGGGGTRMQPSLRAEPRIQQRLRPEPRVQRFNNARIDTGDGVKAEARAKAEAPTFQPTTRAAAMAVRAAARPGDGTWSRPERRGWSSVQAWRSEPASPSARSAQPARPCPARCLRRAVRPCSATQSTFRPATRTASSRTRWCWSLPTIFRGPALPNFWRGTGMSMMELQSFTLTNSTFVRAHVDNRRAVRAVLQGLGNEVTLRTGQPNYLYGARRARAQRSPKRETDSRAVATAGAIRLAAIRRNTRLPSPYR